MSRVFELQLDSPTAKLVLLILADNANDQGCCWPSISTLVRKSCLCERSVRYNLRQLEQLTLIKTKPKNGHSSVYQLTLEDPDPEIATRHEMPPTPAPHAPPGGHHMPPEPSVEPSKEPSIQAEPVFGPEKSKQPGVSAGNPQHLAFIKGWTENFKRKYGFDYAFEGGRDGRAVKELLSMGILVVDLLEIAKRAWNSKEFACKQAVTIHGFRNNFNPIRVVAMAYDPMRDGFGSRTYPPGHTCL